MGQQGPSPQRVALYCRVSTADQSCERQERDLAAFAKRAGYEVVGIYKETVSRVRADRAERNKAMALAQHLQRRPAVPTGLVQHEHGMHARGQGLGKTRQEQVHGHHPRLGQHQGERVVVAGTNSSKDVGGQKASVPAPGRTHAACEPAMAGAALLALAGLVLAPQLQRLTGMSSRDLAERGGDVFYAALPAASRSASLAVLAADGRAAPPSPRR